MKSLLYRIRKYIFMLCLLLVPTITFGQEPHQTTQREWVLTETRLAIKELYYSVQMGEYGNKRQLLKVIKKYNDCFYGDMC